MPIREAPSVSEERRGRSRLAITTSTAQHSVAARMSVDAASARSEGQPLVSFAWPDDQQCDRGDVSGIEPLAEQRYREQRDPHHERLLQERGVGRARALQTLEEQHERDRTTDDADREDSPNDRAA